MKKYILNRPVNALRKGFEPAYLGAKIRASKAGELQAAIIERSVQKKLYSSEDWSYKKHFVFKNIDDAGKREYRSCLSPSPSTAAAEAFLLNELTDIGDLFSSDRVYSYRLSKKNSSANYKYFLFEYEARNREILLRLESAHDLVAVFFDIEKFYPSVKTDLLKSKLFEFYEKTKPRKDTKTLVDFALNQLSKSSSGIPIGTELSHLLANIFLADFDKTLSDKYGNYFFRYVDDITIVCPRNEVDKVRSEVNGLIRSLELMPNEAKAEVYDVSEWRKEIATKPIDGEDFFTYCEVLASWLKADLSRFEAVSKNLRNEGFHIPIKKLIVRQFTRNVQQHQELGLKEIISKTKNLREKYKAAAYDIISSPIGHTRGGLQKARRAINPLFYLLDTSEYKVISEVASRHPKLSVQKEVSDAILSSDCSSLIDYPGSTVSSYCEIWKTLQNNKRMLPTINISLDPDNHHLDALIPLSLHNILTVPDKLRVGSIWTALRSNITTRSDNLAGFDNEIESLRINLNPAFQEELLGQRESEDEEIDMQALELGDQMISS